jgi:hypothetical protein
VPLTAATAELLRDYLAAHPRADQPTAPLFPAMTLTVPKPTGVRALDRHAKPASQDRRAVVQRPATALAELSVAEAEDRLVFDWSEPLRHGAWYKAVYRPAVLRANRLGTPTRACAWRPEYRHSTSAGSWGTRSRRPRSASTCTCSRTTTPTRWRLSVQWTVPAPIRTSCRFDGPGSGVDGQRRGSLGCGPGVMSVSDPSNLGVSPGLPAYHCLAKLELPLPASPFRT